MQTWGLLRFHPILRTPLNISKKLFYLVIKKYIGNKFRLSIFRSNKHIYCQIIDDIKQITLCSSSTLDPEIKKALKGSGTIDAAEKVGKDIAKKAKKLKSKAGLGLGTFIGKTLLERKKANIEFLKSSNGGAIVEISWNNKDFI